MNKEEDVVHGTINRFKIFLQKLETRADEILSETEKVVEAIYQNDNDIYKRSFHLFKNGILGQIDTIIEQAESTWSTRVIPELEAIGKGEHDNKFVFSEARAFEDWQCELQQKAQKIFENFQEKSPYELYLEAVSELENMKKIYCSGCGADIKITKIYTSAKYIACEFCKTENIFTPSSTMRMLGFEKEKICKNQNILSGKYEIEF